MKPISLDKLVKDKWPYFRRKMAAKRFSKQALANLKSILESNQKSQ